MIICFKFSVFESDFERFDSIYSKLAKLDLVLLMILHVYRNVQYRKRIFLQLKDNSYPANILRIDANKNNNSIDLDMPMKIITLLRVFPQ